MFMFLSGCDADLKYNDRKFFMKNKFTAAFIILFIASLSITCKKTTKYTVTNDNDSDPIYQNPNYSVEERVNDLLSRMTLEEKIGQMTQAERQALGGDNNITAFFLGSLLSGGGSAPSPNTPSTWADMYDRFQTAALNTRLGIPLIYGIDAVHGHNNV